MCINRFGNDISTALGLATSTIDGAMSILTGIAANKAIATGLPIDVDKLVKFD